MSTNTLCHDDHAMQKAMESPGDVNEQHAAYPDASASLLVGFVGLKLALFALAAVVLAFSGYPNAAIAAAGFGLLVSIPGFVAVLNRAGDRRDA